MSAERLVEKHRAPSRDSVDLLQLLANLLPFVKPGALLGTEMPNQVFRFYWPMAQAESFAVADPDRTPA